MIKRGYYPFGLEHKGYNYVSTSSNIALKRMFGGKEYQDELGLGWYDISARNYDPALGRWMNLDPLAEQMKRHSSYNYAFNNPLRFIDPDGMSPSDITIRTKNHSGEYQETVVIKTEQIDLTIDVDITNPVSGTVDPITNKYTPNEPIVLDGLDNYLNVLEKTLGQADALQVSIGGGFAGGGGMGGQIDVVAFLNGEDAGGVFLYTSEDPSVNLGLGAGIGVETGGIFNIGKDSNFNRATLEGYTKGITGGIGAVGGNIFFGTDSLFDFTPNYVGATSTLSASIPTGLKAGGYGYVSKTRLKSTLKEPSN